ncbi:hypothetical protein NFI96_001151 [Prochilodus magdalenae]|nr:hypothetical protein NFI96_001151 [Prochilodus magdalenae]
MEEEEKKREEKGDSHHLPELRIVLLGNKYAGKSSAGNTILNKEEFEFKETCQCVKRQGEVAGRHITVVEAPGWWKNIPVEENTELLKQEIMLSVSLCSPGPHALLLILSVDSVFKENYRSVLEGYLKLFTDTVWSHTIVLFTFGDCLGDTPIEQHIESEGKELKWLVEKCGNRYHVLNNKNRSDDTQVTELLEKIEEMVAANSGHCFEMDRKILQEVEEKRRAEKGRVKERMMKDEKLLEHVGSLINVLSTDSMGPFDVLVKDSSPASAQHLYTEHLSMALEEFVPEVTENNFEVKNNNSYRFLCPHAGQFQCRLTNLMFEMEGKGELLYEIESWDTRMLDGLGQMKPAGPLYNIKCFAGNVPLTEVKNQYMDFTNIRTSSKCQLTPGKKYRPFCDPYVPQPKVETFEQEYDQNYHPAFVVHAEAERITISLLDENDVEVWEPRQLFLTDLGAEEATYKMDSAGAKFVDENGDKLIQKVLSVMEIADCLKSKNMITAEMWSNIKSENTSQEQMRILYSALDSGGTAVKEEFYQILKMKHPYLVHRLEAGKEN